MIRDHIKAYSFFYVKVSFFREMNKNSIQFQSIQSSLYY